MFILIDCICRFYNCCAVKIRLRFFNFALVILFAAFVVNAQPPSIVFHTDNPRDFNNYKMNRPDGISTATNILVLSEFKQEYDIAKMTVNRSIDFMRKGGDICVFNRIKTASRSAEFLFSLPVNFYLPKYLFQSAKHSPLGADLLDDNGAVYLPKLFATYPQRTILLPANISHGIALDKLLNKIAPENKLVRAGANYHDGVLGMFKRNRTDYVLLFPQSLIEGSGIVEGVIGYPISGASSLSSGHFMCTNNDRMEKVVSELNQILIQLYKDNSLYQTHLKWLRAEDKNSFSRLYKQALETF